ncbi:MULTISPECIES: hypothetical protein [unclassified Phyllobacterium]|uniref:hypothetical protein n=1 Tax=unclassified Phyllobacterium TaxID=2638441 RepID=UPI003012E5DE
MTHPTSKSDRDRIRGNAGKPKAIVQSVRKIITEYRQGKAASACMAEIEKALGKVADG